MEEQTTETTELLALIGRLERLLERSGLAELEVEAGETSLVLRRPQVLDLAQVMVAPTAASAVDPADAARSSERSDEIEATSDEPSRNAVLAPLTGVFYLSPSPGAAPYVQVGSHVSEGQVIGLIEAMKLFNEIKSDVTGTVTRIVAENGALVKARAPLVEVEP